MSQENVELVRRGFEASNRDVAAGRDFVAPDVEWKPSTAGVIERELDEFVNEARALWEVRGGFRFEETEIRDWADKVLWLGHAHAKDSAGQLVLDQEFAVYFTISAGTIIRIKSYLSYAQAFEAAGRSQ
jgi:ketosteroid isomerase-like protein